LAKPQDLKKICGISIPPGYINDPLSANEKNGD